MSLLISLLILIIVFGVIVWCVSLIPMPSPFKQIAMAVMGLIFLLVVLGQVGYLGDFGSRGIRLYR